jgi:hypothetical protein
MGGIMPKRISVLLLGVGIVAAQQPPPAIFRAETQLVQVSVIAQDKDGQPVADLRREELQIFDNGASQELRLFVAETDKSNFVTESFPSTPPNTFTNQIAAPTGSHSGYSVIVFDNLVTGFGDPFEDGTGKGRVMVPCDHSEAPPARVG